MDVKELLKGCEEMNNKLTGVQQELEACRKRAKKEPEELERMLK